MKDFLKKLKETIGIEADEPITATVSETPSAPLEVEILAERIAPTIAAAPKASKPLLPPAPKKREEIVQFIVNALHPYMDEKNTGIKGLEFYVYCANSEEEELVNVALYADRPDKFKQDELHRKLKNNYIELPPNWFFEINICKIEVPDCRFRQGDYGLDIVTNQRDIKHPALAHLRALTGQTAQPEYLLNAAEKQQYFIGRGQNPQLASGRLHTNDIVFLTKEELGYDAVKGAANPFVSRNHAIISYHSNEGKYYLYADKGGLPESGNKTKIFKSGNRIERLDIDGVAHELSDGDQIELGGEARLLFFV